MKNLLGGVAQPPGGAAGGCSASATCSNGRTYTCTGTTQTWGGDGSTVGCSGSDGNGITCYYLENGVIHSSGYNCGRGYVFT